uniref:BTB domain-containing protein n=1 Tax=Steinernema glaseri TaxID=37863 RepID=A0A1I8AR90_9BILA
MANTGKIAGTLERTATSAEVEIGGAKWSLCRDGYSYEFRCSVGDGTNALWNCLAKGRLTACQPVNGRKTETWTESFNFFMHTMHGYAHSERIYMPFCRNPVNFEAEVEVIKLQVIDLSAPPSKSIVSTEDGACFEVDGEKFWLSKKVLSFHSPVFEAMFSADFKEKATGMYHLKEVKLDDFEMFLSVLYNMDIPITTQKSLEGLLRLGDMWQCDAVIRICRDIISRPDSTFLTLKAKIQLCDRHGFCLQLTAVIEKAELDEVKKLVKDGCRAQLSSFTLNVILDRLAASW